MAKPFASRGVVLPSGPLLYSPENELGVVFLFAFLAKRWRLKIDTIRQGYPDCIAHQSVGGRARTVRIEFEYKAKNFRSWKIYLMLNC